MNKELKFKQIKALEKYGFSSDTIKELMQGRKSIVMYGVVKFNRKTNELTTKYNSDLQDKKQVLILD